MRLRTSLLALGLLAAGLFAWQHRDGGAPDDPAPAPRAPRIVPPAPAAAPARPAAASAPAVADEAPLSVQIERLLATRDPADAYRAYRLIADCAAFNLNHDRIIFDEDDLMHGNSMTGFRAMNEDEKRHDAKLCGGLTERERQSRLDYLAIAAKAGVAGAAVNFATEGPFGDPSALQTRPNDPLVQAWKRSARAQLAQAAESGVDLSALRYLADQYGSGSDLLDKNPLLAYRYAAAHSLILEELVGRSNPDIARTMAAQREAASNALQDASPAQREAELAAARRIADLARARREQAAGKPGAGG